MQIKILPINIFFFHGLVGFSFKKGENIVTEFWWRENYPMTMPNQKTVCTRVSTIYFRNVFLQPAVSDNTRPALSKTFLGFRVFLPRQSNRYRSVHCVCQEIKTAMLQKLFSKICSNNDTSGISRSPKVRE